MPIPDQLFCSASHFVQLRKLSDFCLAVWQCQGSVFVLLSCAYLHGLTYGNYLSGCVHMCALQKQVQQGTERVLLSVGAHLNLDASASSQGWFRAQVSNQNPGSADNTISANSAGVSWGQGGASFPGSRGEHSGCSGNLTLRSEALMCQPELCMYIPGFRDLESHGQVRQG